MDNRKKKRFVVAGQLPPPVGGQAAMIARIINDLRQHSSFDVIHLPFFFTKNVSRTRRAGWDKILQLFAVLARLFRTRMAGPIDGILYPVGGPQLVPLIRDACLLPFMLMFSRTLILHYHAGGIADTIDSQPAIVRGLISFLYGRADSAIVMTEFGKRDATRFRISSIAIVPNTVEDAYDPKRTSQRGGPITTVLYVGHLSEQKGTPHLLEAVSTLRNEGFNCVLDLVGECLPEYPETDLSSTINRLGLEAAVRRPGVLVDDEKWNRFAEADLFVFPSLAPESFGLVTVEAMMWALPVIAFEWRGNREVLGQNFGGMCVDPSSGPALALTQALREAFSNRGQWREWGTRNRQTFENRYSAQRFSGRLPAVLESLV